MKPGEAYGPQRRPAGGRGTLPGEHRCTDVGQLIFVIVILSTWITDSFVLHATLGLAGRVPAAFRWSAGIAVMGVSTWLALSAHRAVFRKGTPAVVLLTGGVYSIVRHPMYLGSWLGLLGLAITTLSLASAAVCAAMLAFYLLVARYEENLLLKVFGRRYLEYRARVPMFFPLMLRRSPPGSSRRDIRHGSSESLTAPPAPERPSGQQQRETDVGRGPHEDHGHEHESH